MTNYAASFLAYLKDRGFSPNTIERYGRVLRAFGEFLEGHMGTAGTNPQSIDKAAVIAFLRSNGGNGTEPSGIVWNGRLACLRTFFGYLYREEQVAENPAVKVEFSRPVSRDPVYPTYPEYEQLVAAVGQHGHPFYKDRDTAIIVAFFHTGLRLSELVSLDVHQVDLLCETFRAVLRKGGNVRDVHFNGEVTRVLRPWLTRRRARGFPKDGPLFVSDRRKRISPRTVERLVVRYSALAGLSKKLTPHTIRHGTATELLRRGEDIRVVSEVLNHSNLNTTKRYTHLVEGAEKRAVDRLARDAPPQ